MKNTITALALLISLVWANSAHAEMTRIYHMGKPNGKPKASLMTSAMSGVGALTSTNAANGEGRVWVARDDGGPGQYSRYDIISSRINVSDYLRSGRTGTRGIRGITNSTLDNDAFFRNHY